MGPRENRQGGDTHAARPTDLMALVGFDDEVYENHAVTRERLGRHDAPGPLGAAIEQWLGLGRHTWLDVRGREIRGIATARELAGDAWIVETLIDAAGAGDEVFEALLRKAVDSAIEHHASHLLLRMELGDVAVSPALRLGFKQVLVEELWHGVLHAPGRNEVAAYELREAGDADEMGRFQLFNRLVPLDARESVAMSLEEWQQTRERRWLTRGASEWVGLDGGRVVGSLALVAGGDAHQLEVLVDPEHAGVAEPLVSQAARLLGRARTKGPVLALAPSSTPAVGAACAAAGLEHVADYVLLCLRVARPVRERRRVTAGMAVPTRG